MKKKRSSNKTEITLKFYFDSSNSDFFIQQKFDSKSNDSFEIISELVDFSSNLQSLLIKKMNTAIQETVIHIESFYNYDEIVEFYDNLLTQIGEISYFDISCSLQVFNNLSDEQKENIDNAFDWMGDKISNMN